MLFVKDILFLDGAVARFAPDIDLLGEVASIATYFADRYGGRIAEEIGVDPREQPVDLTGVRSSLGVGTDTEHLSYRELQARREEVRRKFEQRVAPEELRAKLSPPQRAKARREPRFDELDGIALHAVEVRVGERAVERGRAAAGRPGSASPPATPAPR